MDYYTVQTRPNIYGHTYYLMVNYSYNVYAAGIDGDVTPDEIISDSLYTFIRNVLDNRTDFERVSAV